MIKQIGNRYVLQSMKALSGGGLITKSRFELIPAENKYPYGKAFNANQVINPREIVNTTFNGKYDIKFSEGEGWK